MTDSPFAKGPPSAIKKPLIEQPIWHETEYKQFGKEPRIMLTGMMLVIFGPALLAGHLFVANLIKVPLIQYGFASLLIAFLLNYTLIIRKNTLMPYLPEELYNDQLKKICLVSLLVIVFSTFIGWNGSGGIIYAILWVRSRTERIGNSIYFFLIIIVGSLLLQNNYSMSKILEFLPGIAWGWVNSQLFTLRDSSTYAISHQFLFLCSVSLPILFPAVPMVVPSIVQWLVMLVSGGTMLVAVVLMVKLMQSQQVSVVMAISSGILMLGTVAYDTTIHLVGSVLTIVGVALLIKSEFYQQTY